MKRIKLMLFLSCLLCSNSIFAQQIKNPSFDSVYIGGIDRLWDWANSDATFMGSTISNDTVYPQQANTLITQVHEIFGHIDLYSNTPYSNTCVKLNSTPYKKNNGAPYETFVVNGDHYYTGADGYIDFSKGGAPFPYRPDSLRGYYQFIDSFSATVDYGHCIILLKKYNVALGKIDTIAYVEDSLHFAPNSWTAFSLPITYLSNDQPDSVVVIFKTSTRANQGTSFFIDHLSFVYLPNATATFTNENQLPIVYPNPSSGIIHIENNLNKIKTFRLLNIEGREVAKGPIQNSILLPKSNASTFILQLFSDDGLIKYFKVEREN